MVSFYKTNKNIIELNKPQYIGFTILEFSKLIMVDFHYNHIVANYGNNAKLLYCDTSSLIYHIKTKIFMKNFMMIMINLLFLIS